MHREAETFKEKEYARKQYAVFETVSSQELNISDHDRELEKEKADFDSEYRFVEADLSILCS